MFNIIAETAFSHEGNFEYLLKQINAAKKAKADFVKFQIFLNKDEYIVKSHPDYSVLDKWMFSEKQWLIAFQKAKSLNLKVLTLPLNLSSAKFCLQNDNLIDLYEIHSVCFNEVPLLEELKKTSKKIVLGIGGRLPEEINFSINVLNKKQKDIILMYGFQSFPTEKSMLNLKKIGNFNNIFDSCFGYADHSHFQNDDFLKINTYAYILGASYFEKHIVCEKGKKRIDFESAVSVYDFIKLRKELNDLENILGDGNYFYLNSKEKIYKNREKKIVSNKKIKKGEIIKKEDLFFKISNEQSNFDQKDFSKIINKKAAKNILPNQVINFEHLA